MSRYLITATVELEADDVLSSEEAKEEMLRVLSTRWFSPADFEITVEEGE